LLAGSGRATVTNVNVPSCQSGSPRPLVVVPVAGRDANPVAPVNCTGPAGAAPTSDVDGFVRGYVVETDNLALTPSA
jgi:hypothetical protein